MPEEYGIELEKEVECIIYAGAARLFPSLIEAQRVFPGLLVVTEEKN